MRSFATRYWVYCNYLYTIKKKRDWKSIAKAGEYETCMNIPKKMNNINASLDGACFGGHKEIAEMI